MTLKGGRLKLKVLLYLYFVYLFEEISNISKLSHVTNYSLSDVNFKKTDGPFLKNDSRLQGTENKDGRYLLFHVLKSPVFKSPKNYRPFLRDPKNYRPS